MNDLIGKQFRFISKQGLSIWTHSVSETGVFWHYDDNYNKYVAKTNIKGSNCWYELSEVVIFL